MTKDQQIRAEAIKFLQEREEMVKAGFPVCYAEKGVQFHCNTCIAFYKKRKKTHEKKI